MIFFLFACAEEAFQPVDLGTVSSDGESGLARYATAYGYDAETDVGRQLLVIVSPMPDATCDDVVGWFLTTERSDTYDPRPVLDPGTCVTSFTSTSYDNAGISVASTEDAPAFDVLSNAYCAMEGGEWVEGDDGWAYSGDIWSGTALQNAASVSGGDGEEYAWSIDADAWNGGFPYDTDRLTMGATGGVVGEGVAQWCDGLADTPTFGG